jgi:MIT (microtubule interacting and transport) domain
MSSVQESGAAALLTRAVQLDNEGRYQEALGCYQSGIEQLLQVVKGLMYSHTAFSVEISLESISFGTSVSHYAEVKLM